MKVVIDTGIKVTQVLAGGVAGNVITDYVEDDVVSYSRKGVKFLGEKYDQSAEVLGDLYDRYQVVDHQNI